jgi:hypothetical protein
MRDMIAVLDGIGVNPSASDGGNYSGGSSWAAGFPTLPSSDGLAGYLAAFSDSGFTASAERVNPSASDGGNYGGGSSWAAGFPTLPSTEGLAGAQGYEITPMQVNPSPSEGGNYSGGSDWAPGFPLYPSSSGLAGLHRVRTRAMLHGLTYGGLSPSRAVEVTRRVLRSVSFRATSPCDAAWEATYKAAIAAGFDRAFAKDAADSSGNRCRNEAWTILATKS